MSKKIELTAYILENTHLPNLDCGYANGYVVIPKEHPMFNKHYDDIDVNIHGGLTFSSTIDTDSNYWNRIKNNFEIVSGKVEDIPNSYVVGFDTCHWQDNKSNWNKEACIAETINLKEQLEEMWELEDETTETPNLINCKVVSMDDESITFDNGLVLSSYHEQDCCEDHYLDFSTSSLSDFDGLLFDLTSEDFFERVENYGIRLVPKLGTGHPIAIPGYGNNNGYYSSNLELILTNNNGFKQVYDITECQDYAEE